MYDDLMLENHSAHITILQPPRLGERILSLFLDQEDKEAVIGDFEEGFYLVASKFGLRKARRWYWFEIVRSTPALFFFINKKFTRSAIMKSDHKLAIAGFVLIIPALILCFGGILQSFFGLTQVNDGINYDFFIFHPLIIMGGLILAFGINLQSVMRVRFQFQDGTLVSTIKVKGKVLNLGLVAVIMFLLATIFLYLLAENFQIFQATAR